MPQPLIIAPPRRFDFERDAFAFPNELVCAYEFDPGGGHPKLVARRPRPDYALRCFVMVRAARSFFLHADFRPEETQVAESHLRRRVREVVSRNPRVPSMPDRRVAFPGFAGLRAFSQAHEALLKAECGGAWRSYVLRSHWRMVLPISRTHQQRTRARLVERLAHGAHPIVHLVRFPQLTINHGMLLMSAETGRGETRFAAYDPNDPSRPATLAFEEESRSFRLPANRYWPGGTLDVLEICRNWWF